MSLKHKKILRILRRCLRYLVIPVVIAFVFVFYFSSFRHKFDDGTPSEQNLTEEVSYGEDTADNILISDEEFNDIRPEQTAEEKYNLFDAFNEIQRPSYLKITVLDVGQASATLIESNGEYMIFDGGDKLTSSFIVSYLKEQNIDSLKYMVVSHYHADHVYGLIGVIESGIKVENYICPDYKSSAYVQEAFLQRVNQKKIIYPYIEQRFAIGGATARCISPVTDDYSDDNGYSVGLMIEIGNFSFLIDGDATEESEIDMLESNVDIDADVLVVAHHGSKYSNSLDWLKRVTPQTAIISCGANNSYYQPHKQVLDNLSAVNVQTLYRTDLNGNITVWSDGTCYSVSTDKEAQTDALWKPGEGEGE